MRSVEHALGHDPARRAACWSLRTLRRKNLASGVLALRARCSRAMLALALQRGLGMALRKAIGITHLA